MNEKQYLNVTDIAKITGLNPYTIRKLLQDNIIKGKKVRNTPKSSWIISKKNLDEYLDI